MTGRSRRTIVGIGLVPMFVVAALCLVRPGVLTPLERGVYDVLSRAADPRPHSGRVVIVDVDERSLRTFGQWPWRRDRIGQLISNLRALGASVIALDIIFAEPDRSAGPGVDPDAELARAIGAGRVVLGYGLTFDDERTRVPCAQHPLQLAILEPPGVHSDRPFFDATSAVCNMPALVAASRASGFLNAAPDSDGILRRVPLLAQFEGRVYPSLALAAVSSVIGADEPVLRVANANASWLSIGNQEVPLDGTSSMLVRFRGPKRTFPYVSAGDVLQGRAPADAVSGKMVFIGTTALGTREVVATPLDTLFTGVEVQATTADNLLQRDPFRRASHAVAVETAAVLWLCGLVFLVVWRFSLLWGGFAVAAGAAMSWYVSAELFAREGMFLSPLYPTLATATGFVAMVIAGFTTERARAEQAGEANETSRRLMVQSLLSLTGIRDLETGQHSQRVQRYTRVVAEQLARNPAYRDYLTPERIELMASLAPLHDIGKVGVPDRVLNKPGQLTPDELAEMRRHPRYGRDVIERAQRAVGIRDDLTLAVAKDIVYTHHEKWDGSGYPEGLKGAEIPIPGRVMALVDVYDAVHTRRLYDAPRSHAETIALIRRGTGTHFDPAVVEAFVAVADTLDALSEAEHPTESVPLEPTAAGAARR